MKSIENILRCIEENTKTEINQIKEHHLKECEKISKEAKTTIEAERKLNEAKISKKKEELKKNFEIELEHIKKKFISWKKEEIFQRTINLAFEKFCDCKKETYFKFIEKLISKNKPEEEHKIFIGKKDHDFYMKNQETENAKNVFQSENFDHGFKIICEKYLLDFDMKKIFENEMTKLRAKSMKALDMEES